MARVVLSREWPNQFSFIFSVRICSLIELRNFRVLKEDLARLPVGLTSS